MWLTYENLVRLQNIVLGFVALKAILMGSDFSFYNAWKYGLEYLEWYDTRPKFKHKEN